MHNHVRDQLRRYKSMERDIQGAGEGYAIMLMFFIIVSILCGIRIGWVLTCSDTIPYVSSIILCAIWLSFIFIEANERGEDGWYSLLNKAKLYKIDNTTVGIEGFDIRIHVEDIQQVCAGPAPIFIIYDESRVYMTDMSLYRLSSLAGKMLKALNDPVSKKETAASILSKCRTTGE